MSVARAQSVTLVCLAALAVALVACADPTAPSEPTLPSDPPGVVAPSWPRIEEERRIVVGTSPDYPPFAYYDGDFRIDGLDPALIRALGDALGLDVVLRDIAFDGLGGALQVGQIDAAIAAISVTPERAAVVAFTQAYYVGQDAVLVPRSSAVTVTRIEDLASLQVGVQRGSVYESALQKQLVDEGLMLPTQLFAYGAMDRALADLAAERIGAVVLDLQPARVFAESDTVRVAAEGLQRQRFAIAVRQGDDELLQRLDETLARLQSEGEVSRLIATHVGEAAAATAPMPTETPAPVAATPMPTPRCVDAMELVEHLTYDDKGMTAPPTVPGGQPFVKTWRLLNNGTCAWNTSYTLEFARGNAPGANMGAMAVPIPGTVEPGATLDMSVNLVAPPLPGVYQGRWQLHDSMGEAFGETLPVGIIVPVPPAPSPAPTQTPVPGVRFGADRTWIRSGECVRLTWKVEGARAVYLYPKGAGYSGRDVAPEGVRTECPSGTTTFVLRAELINGTVQEREVTVVVEHVSGMPWIVVFRAEPGRIGAGGCVEVAWDVQGNVGAVTVTRDGGSLWDNAPFRASTRDCPPGRGLATYRLQATGPGGTARSEAAVIVE